MAEENHRGLFHHKTEDDNTEKVHDYAKEEKQHKNRQHLAELGAAAAGLFAVHESHKAKKDPENAQQHKIQEGIAAAVAVGAGGFAFHERHEKKDAKKEAKEGH